MLEHVEKFVRAGWRLEVNQRAPRFQASVTHQRSESHHYMGSSLDDALTGLNVYLSQFTSRDPTTAESK